MLFQSLALAGLASLASASLYITSPVATTTCTGGAACKISWEDDSKSPSLKDYGICSVGLYTGTVNQQTMAISFGTVDPATDGSMSAMIPATAGPNGNFYFIRFISQTNQTLSAFSAKFELTGMSGALSPAASAQLSGASAAPVSASGAAASSSPMPSSSLPSSASRSASSSAPSAARTSSTSGAEGRRTGCAAAAAAAVALAGALAFSGL